jgi:hypothetical protein
MYELHCRVFFIIIAVIGIIASVPDGSAQVIESQKLPPQIAALVPPGTQLTHQSVSVSRLLARIDFFAEKKSGLRSQTITQYHLTFSTFEDNAMWKRTLGPASREQVETESKQTAQNWGAAQSAMVSPPEVTQYPWGSGMTQRRRFYGDGAPDFFSYQCAYFGLAGTTRFELTVGEIADRAEADKWATKVAETAAKITLSSISK